MSRLPGPHTNSDSENTIFNHYGEDTMKTEPNARTMKYKSPKIRRVVLENKKPLLASCKVEKADNRGLGPCQSEMGAVCKEP